MSNDWKSALDPKPARCEAVEPTERGQCERNVGHPGPHAFDPWDDWGPRYWNDKSDLDSDW